MPESSEPDRCRETACSLSSGILVTSAASVTAAVSSVTVGVTDPGTVIASALRRIRPACSQAFSRRLVRILFQPHWRPSLVSGIDSHASLGLGAQPSQRLQGHRGAFTPIPAGSPALDAVSGTTRSGLRADVREVSVERASAFSGCSQGPLSRPRRRRVAQDCRPCGVGTGPPP